MKGTKKSRLRQLLYGSLVAALLVSTISIKGGAAADADVLQQDVSALQNAGNVGVLAAVRDHGQTTTARAGAAQLGTSQPVPLEAQYRMGSVTKTFVATTLLQLVGEGKLTLDDTVDQWLPGVITGNGNDGTHITVRQLLNHTAGLFDYVNDDAFFATLATPEAFSANQNHHYSPQDLITIALSHQPTFAPGAGWAYSNTNYIVAGEIIKAVTGYNWDVEVTNRIITPLDLTNTIAPGDSTAIPGDHAHGYHIFTTSPSSRAYTDTTEHNMTWAGAAGALITTTNDANIFFSALLSGQLLPPAQLAQMKTLVPVENGVGYGLGIVGQDLSCSNQRIWWHNGGTVGYATWAGTTEDGSLSLNLSLSTTTFTDDTFFAKTDNRTNKLIKHVFCGSQATGDEQLSLLNLSIHPHH